METKEQARRARYMTKLERHGQIIDAATEIAKKDGFNAVTITAVADHIQANHQLISYYFGKIANVRTAVVEKALKDNDAAVMFQAVVSGLLKMDDVPVKAQKAIQQQLFK